MEEELQSWIPKEELSGGKIISVLDMCECKIIF